MVIVSHMEEPVDFAPMLANRVLNLVPVDDVETAFRAVTSYTQTIGIWPENLKIELRDRLASHGEGCAAGSWMRYMRWSEQTSLDREYAVRRMYEIGNVLDLKENTMLGMGDGSCPFEFNFDPATFKPGDVVSYRVTGTLEGMPFVGTLVEVHEDHVIILPDPQNPDLRYTGTREDRPVVDESQL